jgi:hypothetical protein
MWELDRCKERLEKIEKLEITYNDKTLREKMKLLDDLD